MTNASARIRQQAPHTLQSPAELALFLQAASPQRAAAFALVMHERACEGADGDQAEFWSGVMDSLRPE